jgi:2-methylisocitrate lyase-like PEP mutase family enzyme
MSAATLRSLLKETVVAPGVYDGLGARVCLKHGFKVLYMVGGNARTVLIQTGAGTAVSTLGMPDLGLATADDMVRNASMIASLDRSVPVVADADTGYGGPVMVERTVSASRRHL